MIIVIVILIVIIKRIVITKVMRMGMGMGTIIDGGESFSRQKTRDRYPPLPSTPPSWCGIFTTSYYWEYMGVCVTTGLLDILLAGYTY